MIRRRQLLQALAAAPALLAGCHSPGRGGRADAGPIVLDFWNGFTGPDGKTMEKIVRQFRAENPGIEVRMQIIPWGTYYDKLTLGLAYRSAPDVFIVHVARFAEFASFGVLRALDDLLGSDAVPLTPADVAPAPWNATIYRGQRFGLPLDVHPAGMYYNPSLFRQAGIVDSDGKARPPTNWGEFLDAARRMTRDLDGDGRPDQWGFVFTFQRQNWYSLATQYGGGIMAPDGRTCILDCPANVDALRLMHEMIYTHRIAPKPEGIDAWLEFRQGKVGMAFEGIYMLASLEEQKGLDYAGAPVPRIGPRPGVWAGSHVLCQPASLAGERAAAAWRFMRYLSDHSYLWATGGQVPVRRSVLASPEFQRLPVQSQFSRELPYVRYEPLIPQTNALFPFVDPAIESVLLDLQTPEAALADGRRRIEQVLART